MSSMFTIFAPIYDNIFMAYSTASQDGNDAYIAINFTDQLIQQSSYNHSTTHLSNRIDILKTAPYKISYSCSWISTTTTNRHVMENYLRKDGSTQINPSSTFCYIRQTVTDGNRCTNSAVVLANLSSGSYIELIGGRFAGSVGDTLVDSCQISIQEVIRPVVQAYDITGGNDFDSSTVQVNLDNFTHSNSSYFQTLTDSINITQDGIYHVYYTVCSESTGQNNRQIVQSFIEKNGVNISQSFAYSYLRQTGTADRNCNTNSVIQNFTEGDIISLHVNKYSKEGTGSTITFQDQSWMMIERVNRSSEITFVSSSINESISSTDQITYENQTSYGKFSSIDSTNTSITLSKSGLYEITYGSTWEDDGGNDRFIGCGVVRRSSNPLSYSETCDYSRGDLEAKRSSIFSSFIFDASRGDIFDLLFSSSGSVTTLLSNSNYFSIKKLEEKPTFFVTSDPINLGIGDVTVENLSSNITLLSQEAHTNVYLSCVFGNCSQFNFSFVQGRSFVDQYEENVTLFCNNNTESNTYNVIFNFNSTQNPSGVNFSASCSFSQKIGNMSSTLISPMPSKTYRADRYKHFNVTASVDCVGTIDSTCGNVTSIVRYRFAYGDTTDGDINITTQNTIVNNYSHLIGNELANETVITVNDTSGFSASDEIFIYQVQNGTGNGVAGQYEFARIRNISGNDITLYLPLENSYYSGIFNSTTSQVSQIVRVPQYNILNITTSGSITALPWNGLVGGVVVFRSLNTYFNGYVNVSEDGYRGGRCGDCGNGDWGTQGEGYLGIGSDSLDANGNGGGGGYGPSGFGGEGGAGGGHRTSGGDSVSTNIATGGEAIGNSNLSLIYFGGGAGAGGDNDDQLPRPENISGGGIAMIFSQQMYSTRVLSNGQTGIAAGGAGGTTGSGAGGTIWLVGDTINITEVNATGGPTVSGNDQGGLGSDGRIRLDFLSVSGSPSSPLDFNGTILDSNLFLKISEVIGDSPFFITNNSGHCGIMRGGDICNVTFIFINATGFINSSYDLDVLFISDNVRVASDVTPETTIKIVYKYDPIIIFINPLNGSKFIQNNMTFNFTWRVLDDFENLTCRFYLNDVLNHTTLCQHGINTSYFTTVPYNTPQFWSINVTDYDNNSVYETRLFYLIQNQSKRVEKRITADSTPNFYRINISMNNTNDADISSFYINDFVATNFSAGSFTPSFTFTNLLSSLPYAGRLYRFNFSNSTVSDINVSYVVSGTEDYKTSDLFIVGLE